MNAFARQALKHLCEHFTGFEFDRLFSVVGSDQHLPQRLRFPCHRFQCARHQTAHRIRIAVVEAVIANREQTTLHTQQYAILRQLQYAAGGDFFEHVDWITLAIEVPGNVQANQIDITHLGVALAKGTHFGEQVSADSVHRVHPLL
ncbi:hypothetical protein D3C81_1563380 [compost metagenome]